MDDFTCPKTLGIPNHCDTAPGAREESSRGPEDERPGNEVSLFYEGVSYQEIRRSSSTCQNETYVCVLTSVAILGRNFRANGETCTGSMKVNSERPLLRCEIRFLIDERHSVPGFSRQF